MRNRYRAVVALTSLLLVNATHPPHRPAKADQIFSSRALRRARTILQLKLLELRKERLDRIRRALERGIPLEELLKQLETGRV